MDIKGQAIFYIICRATICTPCASETPTGGDEVTEGIHLFFYGLFPVLETPSLPGEIYFQVLTFELLLGLCDMYEMHSSFSPLLLVVCSEKLMNAQLVVELQEQESLKWSIKSFLSSKS